MKNVLALIGGVYVLKTVYKTGEKVGELKMALKEIKQIHKDLQREKQKIWETEARA